MKGSFFQRHLVENSYAVAKSWPEQTRLSGGEKPLNAEFEQWTRHLQGQENGVAKVKSVAHEKASAKLNGAVDEFDDESAGPGIRLRK